MSKSNSCCKQFEATTFDLLLSKTLFFACYSIKSFNFFFSGPENLPIIPPAAWANICVVLRPRGSASSLAAFASLERPGSWRGPTD